MQSTESKKKLFVWLAAFSLVALGAKLWTIQLWLTNIPYWDQWDEARQLFQPWLDGQLTWQHFFQPHNEHRIVFTRLLDCCLIKLNGQWDMALSTLVNSFLHIGYGCGLITLLWQFIGRRHVGLISCALLPLFALPFAAENTIHGFQSQFYFANLFSVMAIVGMGFGQPGRAIWWCGLSAAVFAIFTVASGFLAAAAIIGLIFLRAIRARRMTRGQVIMAVCALAVLALGWSLKVDLAQHAGLAAQSATEFIFALASNLAWPFTSHLPLLLLMQLPLVVVAWKFFRGEFQNPRAAELVLALGMWAVLQAAALAFGRASIAGSSRYFDTLSALTIANVGALFVLATLNNFSARWQKILPTLALGWLALNLVGQGLLTRATLADYLEDHRGWGLIQTQTVQEFMSHHDLAQLKSKSRAAIPYWNAEWLAETLRQPKLAAIFPADVFPPGHPLKKSTIGSAAAQWLVNQAVWILLAGTFLCLGLAVLALRVPGTNFLNAGGAWIVVLTTFLLVAWGVWSQRGLNRDRYEVMLHQRIAFIYEVSGRRTDAVVHWRAALQLEPNNADIRRALDRLSASAATNSAPSSP